jgi:hypothetical protein
MGPNYDYTRKMKWTYSHYLLAHRMAILRPAFPITLKWQQWDKITTSIEGLEFDHLVRIYAMHVNKENGNGQLLGFDDMIQYCVATGVTYTMSFILEVMFYSGFELDADRENYFALSDVMLSPHHFTHMPKQRGRVKPIALPVSLEFVPSEKKFHELIMVPRSAFMLMPADAKFVAWCVTTKKPYWVTY